MWSQKQHEAKDFENKLCQLLQENWKGNYSKKSIINIFLQKQEEIIQVGP